MSLEWPELLRALALVMVIEGLMPFAAPSHWRRMLQTVSQMPDRGLRLLGVASMAAGLILLQLV